MEYALLKPPYRTFLNNNSTSSSVSSSSLVIIYNLPTSVTEYTSPSSQDEISFVKSTIYQSLRDGGCVSSNNNDGSRRRQPIVISFDSSLSSSSSSSGGGGKFVVDCDEEMIYTYLTTSTNNNNLSLFAKSTLTALSKLDTLSSSQLFNHNDSENENNNNNGGDVIVLLGSGGREHALSVSLSSSPLVSKVICLPGNGGTSTEKSGGKIINATSPSSGVPITNCDNKTVIELVTRVHADMVVVGPEQPLVDGIVDELQLKCPNVKVFGPTMAGAELEASKVSKEEQRR